MECTNCILTSGFLQNCDSKTLAGNKKTMFFIDNCKLNGYTLSNTYYSGSIVDDIFLKEITDEWHSVSVYADSLQTTETISNVQNRAYIQTITFVIAHYGANADKELAAMQANEFLNELNNSDGITAIIQDVSGVYRCFGIDAGLLVTELTKDSGVAQGDTAGTTVVMSRETSNLAPVVSKAYVDTMPKS